jgi:hypothetical protein
VSYQRDRDYFIARMTKEGLDMRVIEQLLRAATTLQRYAELACSSEAADRDRVPCPAKVKAGNACLCDRPFSVLSDEDSANGRPGANDHQDVTRITVQEYRLVSRLQLAVPADWSIDTQGDPRGYVLRVVPPSYAERNKDRDRFNLDTIGVPSGPTRLRF